MSELNNNICEVTFTKANGNERVMICTTQNEFLPPLVENSNKHKTPTNDDIQVVYELKNGWRSYRKDSVTNFRVLTNEEQAEYEGEKLSS